MDLGVEREAIAQTAGLAVENGHLTGEIRGQAALELEGREAVGRIKESPMALAQRVPVLATDRPAVVSEVGPTAMLAQNDAGELNLPETSRTNVPSVGRMCNGVTSHLHRDLRVRIGPKIDRNVVAAREVVSAIADPEGNLGHEVMGTETGRAGQVESGRPGMHRVALVNEVHGEIAQSGVEFPIVRDAKVPTVARLLRALGVQPPSDQLRVAA